MRPSTAEPNVSVVIVSYNTRDLLRRAVASVSPEHEVLVVDNASADGSAEMVRSEFPRVQLIANSTNVGFGAANNQGIKAASGSLVLLMNPDACAEPGAVAELARVFDDPRVVAAGGRLLHPDGRLQESAASRLTLWAVFCEQTYLEKAFKRSRVFSPYWLSGRLLLAQGGRERTNEVKVDVNGGQAEPTPNLSESLDKSDHPHLSKSDSSQASPLLDPSHVKGEGLASPSARQDPRGVGPFEVAQVMGACLMMRPLELFDERFFLYCEDTELCRRLSRHGKILYVPAAAFHHELGAGSSSRWEAVARYNRGKELYFRIHHGRFACFVCFLLDRFGAKIRMIGWAVASVGLRARARDKAALFWKVVTAPVGGPRMPPRTGR